MKTQDTTNNTKSHNSHTVQDVTPAGSDRQKGLKLIGGLAVILIILFVIGLYPIISRHTQLSSAVNEKESAIVQVAAVAASPEPKHSMISLPGNIDAVEQTAVIARAGGYVEKWLVDIGDKVKAGQLLAVIATPDLDQEVAQATSQVTGIRSEYAQILANLSSLQAKLSESQSNYQRALAALDQSKSELVLAISNVAHARQTVAEREADLVQGQSDLKLADVTSKRYQNMLADGAVDQESADEAAATDESDAAKVNALQASVQASKEDVNSELAAETSAQANIRAFASSLESNREDIAAAKANVDAGRAAVAAASDNIIAGQANLARLSAMQGFNQVTAPFDGVITARNIDVGSLIASNGAVASGGGSTDVGSTVAGASAGGNAASGSAAGDGASSAPTGGQSSLFSIAKLDQLRVYVNIPQADVESIKVGQPATVTVSQLPNETFSGIIDRSSGALDPVSRTLIAEVRLQNTSGILRPGMFATVHIKALNTTGGLLIPDAAMVTGAAGTTVAEITNDSTIHFQPITVGRDFGQVIEVTSGLSAGQRIVATPSDGLKEGEKVDITGPVQSVTMKQTGG